MEEDVDSAGVVLSPEEMRKRRLAYFQSGTKAESVERAKEEAKFPFTKQDAYGKKKEEKDDMLSSLKKQSTPINYASESVSHQDIFPSEVKAMNSFHSERKRASSEDQIRKENVMKESKADSKKMYREERKIESEPDEFSRLREELKVMNRDDNEEQYDARVEKLIQLTKKEIAQREKSTEKLSDRSVEKEVTAGNKGSPSFERAKKSSSETIRKFGGSQEEKQKKASKEQSGDDRYERVSFEGPKKVDHVDEFFVKGRESGKQSKSKGVTMSMMESQEEGSVMFQKSLNFAAAEELGLSTHRGETDREGSVLTNATPGGKSKGESPGVFWDYDSDELKSERGGKGEEVPDRNKKEGKDIFQSSFKGERKVASVPGVSKSTSYGEQRQHSHSQDLWLNLRDLHHVPPTEESNTVGGGGGGSDGADTSRDTNQPRLHRPRHEPSNIYQQETEEEFLNLPPSFRHERPAMPRSVVFSTSQIYQQAFRDQFVHMVSYPGGVPGGSPTMMPPSGRGYYGHTSPSVYQSMQFSGHPLAGMPQSSQAFYPPPQHAVPMATPHHMMIPHPPPGGSSYPPYNYAMPPGGQSRMPHAMYEGGDNQYHQQLTARSQHTNDSFASHRGMPVNHARIPRPPEERQQEMDTQPHPAGDSNTRLVPHQQMAPNLSYHYDSMPYSARSSVDGPDFRHYLQQMPSGIPYPPPPTNVDLDAYFKFVGAQGYPVPYPVFIPQQVAAPQTSKAADGTPGNAPSPGEAMIPHPPAQGREDDSAPPPRKTSPRRSIKHDSPLPQKISPSHSVEKPGVIQDRGRLEREAKERKSAAVVRRTEAEEEEEDRIVEECPPQSRDSSSQRHIEAIRQYHEQKRQLDAEEDALLEKNRKFAEASLNRYFQSLEHLYRRRDKQHQSDDSNGSEQNVAYEGEEVIEEEDDLDLRTNVNTEVSMVTSVKAGGITNRIEQLGIDLSFLKKSHDPDVAKEETSDNKSKKSKLVVICPECEEMNKEYMSWCGKCGEVLIGVDPVMVKKTKGGKLLVEAVKKTKSKTEKPKDTRPDVTSENIDANVNQTEVKGQADQVAEAMFAEDGRDAQKRKSLPKNSNIERSQKEIAEICENITDPVVKGFLKSFLRKKRHEVTSTDAQTDETLVSDRDVSSVRSTTKQKSVTPSSRREKGARTGERPPEKEKTEIQKGKREWTTKKPVRKPKSPSPFKSSDSDIKENEETSSDERVATMQPQKTKVGRAVQKPVTKLKGSSAVKSSDSENVRDIGEETSNSSDDRQENYRPPEQASRHKKGKKPIFGQKPVRKPKSPSPVKTSDSENARETPEEFSAQFQANDSSDERDEGFWYHEQAQKNKADRPIRFHNAPPIDIEIFAMEESRRSSRVSEPIVPALELVNSSDEERERRERDRTQQKPKIYSMSADSEDWEDFFYPKPQLVEPPVGESPSPEEEESGQPFLEIVLEDMPKKGAKGGKKGSYVPPIRKSIVKESIEAPSYQRKWEKSSTAWSSYNARELSTRPSGPVKAQRPASAGMSRNTEENQDVRSPNRVARGTGGPYRPQRPSSAGTTRKSDENLAPKSQKAASAWKSEESLLDEQASNRAPRGASGVAKQQRPSSAGVVKKSGDNSPLREQSPARGSVQSKKSRPVSAEGPKRKKSAERGAPDVTTSSELKKIGVCVSVNFDKHADLPRPVDHRLQNEELHDVVEHPLPGPDAAASAYNRYHEMTPRIRVGDYSMWLCLPDEILLHIFSYLNHSDLGKCARTCQQYHRVAKDPSLWRYITLKKNHNLTDDGLLQIGRHKPVSLALIQCHGDNVTAKGLREMFRECADSLRELNFCGCSRGALTGDCILLHASARCHNLTHVDASWCNVSDSGVGAISSAASKLESLCINGCQLLSDEGLETVIKKHGKSLRVIEMFGCFNITPKGMRYLANNCVNLTTLNLGQCYKLTDICISQLSASLGRVENLDLRGCKTIKDNCIRYVVKNCPRLKVISLANCPNISDVSLLEISTYLSDIRSIDVCGCRQVTDSSIRAIANNCQNLRYIDISSTGCTHRGVSMLANFCSQRIETMKLNFLSDITENCLTKLLKHCRRLKLLHLYGCPGIRNIDKIRQINPEVKIEL